MRCPTLVVIFGTDLRSYLIKPYHCGHLYLCSMFYYSLCYIFCELLGRYSLKSKSTSLGIKAQSKASALLHLNALLLRLVTLLYYFPVHVFILCVDVIICSLLDLPREPSSRVQVWGPKTLQSHSGICMQSRQASESTLSLASCECFIVAVK